MCLCLCSLLFGCLGKSYSVNAQSITTNNTIAIRRIDIVDSSGNVIGQAQVGFNLNSCYPILDPSYSGAASHGASGSMYWTTAEGNVQSASSGTWSGSSHDYIDITKVFRHYRGIVAVKLIFTNSTSDNIYITPSAIGTSGWNLQLTSSHSGLSFAFDSLNWEGVYSVNSTTMFVDLLSAQQYRFRPNDDYAFRGQFLVIPANSSLYSYFEFSFEATIEAVLPSYMQRADIGTVEAELASMYDLYLGVSLNSVRFLGADADITNFVGYPLTPGQWQLPNDKLVGAVNNAANQAHSDAQKTQQSIDKQTQQQQQQFDEFMKPADGSVFGGLGDVSQAEGLSAFAYINEVKNRFVAFVDAGPGAPVMTWPAWSINVGGTNFQVWTAQDVDVGKLMDNFPVLLDAIHLGVVAVLSSSLLRYIVKMWHAIFMGGPQL